ncbi:uncharacterized protein LOC103313699 [Tribolium castaneum]|uniref:XRCC4 N-terminal domain-containing protein n=1 Tax=Tribolium castaneum TaxID=7070 RepID=A0A139WEY3_TRICA|nr:PREDICTED: uncharacterized protein LOC103313699 [Tribolium castaneum]KYB26425.1 hypothetical protein TcasGA2_TC033772 [Tribolium castaneum]|eukprot:XP_008195875.1 PREDICTED: uncharacterized protein LOC103313699 [Tribolium castaneum]
MENCVFKQIYSEENTPLRVHFTLLEDGVTLIILQNENAWKSTLSKDDLKYFATEYKLNFEEYCSKLSDYIKTADPDIIFTFKNNTFSINRLLKNSLKVKFFTCKLEKTNYVEQVEQIMDTFYVENTELSEKLNVVMKEKDEIDKHKTCCEQKLKELIQKKQSDEEEQFGQFLSILNEKKFRIQHLTELLEAFKNGRPTVNLPVNVKSKKRKNETTNQTKKLETISESEASNSSDIDNKTDSDDASNHEENSVPSESKPSTSAQDFDFLNDDDIPLTSSLPKRLTQKRAPSEILVKTVDKASTAPKTEPEEPPKKAKKKASINISTQDLLDML